MTQLARAAPDIVPLTDRASAAAAAPCRDRRPILVATLVFAALSLAAGLPSEAFLEADACTHYLYSRFLFDEPYRLVDVWGRPVCTAVYAVPAALFGRVGTKVCSLLLALGVAWTAYGAAKAQGLRLPAMAFVAVLAQPLVFLHSFTEMTELPFALLLGLAFWAYCRGRWGWCALLTGFLPLARPEGFGFILLVGLALLVHRRWWAVPLLAVGLVGWNHLGWEMFGRQEPWWRWLPDHWPYDAGSLYERGSVFKFIATLPAVVGPLLLPATIAGGMLVVHGARARRATSTGAESGLGLAGAGMDAAAPSRFRALWRRWSDLTRPDVVTLLVPALVLVGHSVLHATGRMASNGELRYMLIVAPFWGLLTARGVAWLADRLNVRRPYLLVGALALAPALVNLHYRIVPVQLQRDERIAAAAARWWRSWPDRDRYPTVISPHPAVYYYMDRSPTSWSRDQITDPRPGVLLVFNDMYGSYNADSTRSITTDLILASGWTPVEAADPVLDIRPEPEPENKGLDWRFRAKWSNWRVYRSPTSAVE